MNINKDEYTDTNFITGMRGYSALGVFLIHSGAGGLGGLGYFFSELVNKGKYGVVSFFVISAFTIAMSINNSKAKKRYTYFLYLLNRFLRIFPLYFILLLFAFIMGGNPYYQNMFDVKNSIENFLLQISLLNVFFVKHRNNLIGTEWTISLEFFYYLLFPAMLTVFYKFKKSRLYLSPLQSRSAIL